MRTNCSVGFPNESARKDLSFELPREDGTNDSYSAYVQGVNQNPSTQMKIMEEILDSYGPLPNQDTMLLDYDWATSLEQGQFEDMHEQIFQTTHSCKQKPLLLLASRHSYIRDHLQLSRTLEYRRKI